MLHPIQVTCRGPALLLERPERLFAKQSPLLRIAQKLGHGFAKRPPVLDRTAAPLKVKPLVESFKIKNVRTV